jgi:hypothetical protein
VLTRQRAVMVLFDALIQNVDRNLANQLWTPADWRLHLIDHSRGFRLWKDLPEEFAGAPASLPRALLAGLEGLEEESLAVGLERLVSRAQIKALLKRRDRILEKIASDRQQYGDAMVFQD